MIISPAVILGLFVAQTPFVAAAGQSAADKAVSTVNSQLASLGDQGECARKCFYDVAGSSSFTLESLQSLCRNAETGLAKVVYCFDAHCDVATVGSTARINYLMGKLESLINTIPIGCGVIVSGQTYDFVAKVNTDVDGIILTDSKGNVLAKPTTTTTTTTTTTSTTSTSTTASTSTTSTSTTSSTTTSTSTSTTSDAVVTADTTTSPETIQQATTTAVVTSVIATQTATTLVTPTCDLTKPPSDKNPCPVKTAPPAINSIAEGPVPTTVPTNAVAPPASQKQAVLDTVTSSVSSSFSANLGTIDTTSLSQSLLQVAQEITPGTPVKMAAAPLPTQTPGSTPGLNLILVGVSSPSYKFNKILANETYNDASSATLTLTADSTGTGQQFTFPLGNYISSIWYAFDLSSDEKTLVVSVYTDHTPLAAVTYSVSRIANRRRGPAQTFAIITGSAPIIPPLKDTSSGQKVLDLVVSVVQNSPVCAQTCFAKLPEWKSVVTVQVLTNMCANLGADVGLFVTCVNDLCGPAKDLKSKDDLWKTVSALNLIPDNCSILLNKKVVYSFSQTTDQTGIIAKDENGKLVAGPVTTSTSTTTSTKTTGTTTATTTAAAVVTATPARTTTIVKTTAKAQTNIVVSGASETIMFSIIGFVFSVFMV